MLRNCAMDDAILEFPADAIRKGRSLYKSNEEQEESHF